MPEQNQVKYPQIVVQLSGTDGNAFAVIGTVSRALRRAGIADDAMRSFYDEIMASDYDNVLATAMRWVTVE